MYNAFFIAAVDQVWVYEPIFPLQKLGTRVLLKINLPKSSPRLRGYIDRHNPHSITHLQVALLGFDEVVLVTCDDGDVLGFRVEDIQQAVERRQEPDSAENVYASELRPFLHENVGMSAWGLAVHTEARKIAVSSNTHQVTVFEYALAEVEKPEDDRLVDEIAQTSWSTTGATRSNRDQDTRYTLHGQSGNIPCVAFCNTGEDPSGRFLACGDLNGITYIWDLDLRRMAEVNRLEFCTATARDPTCHCFSEAHQQYGHMGKSAQLFRYLQ